MLKNALFTSLLAAFCAAGVSAQELVKLRVIATNGLKLRAAPSREAKVLDVAPFWSEVEKDPSNDRWHWPAHLDTVEVITKFSYYSGKAERIVVQGTWVLVKFRGKKGYMFGSYLGYFSEAHNHHRDVLDDDFRLRTTDGTNGISNWIEQNGEFKWNGVFRKGDKFEVRPITLRYASADPESGVNTFADVPGDQPSFMIGTKSGLQSHVFTGSFFNWWKPSKESEIDWHGLKAVRTPPGSDHEWDIKGLNPEIHREDGEVLKFQRFDFAGDIDGDGKTDYVALYGSDHASYVLFLSSKAKKGEGVHAVAILHMWDPC